MTIALSPLIAMAHRHAVLEGEGDLEGVMATMEGEPLYEFFPMGKFFKGMDEVRRYYEFFYADFGKRIVAFKHISESIGPVGLIGEYDMMVQHDGDAAPTRHRIMTMLTFGEKGITGERMFSDDKLFRTMLGPQWDILESVDQSPL